MAIPKVTQPKVITNNNGEKVEIKTQNYPDGSARRIATVKDKNGNIQKETEFRQDGTVFAAEAEKKEGEVKQCLYNKQGEPIWTNYNKKQ